MNGGFPSPGLFINFVSFINTIFNIFKSVKDVSLDIFMMFGPSANYVFQAVKFYQTKSSKGFSNYLCLVTIFAHTTKIFFWFGERYKYTLLFQSFLVILILLYIIYLYLKYREKPEEEYLSIKLESHKNILLKDKIKQCTSDIFGCSKILNPKLFWQWDKAREYYKFYFLVVSVLTLLLFAFGVDNKYYANALGSINLVLELLCSLPQIIELYRTKNQKNISKIMVMLWFTGNILKIYYNHINNSPIQLLLGACIQVFFNIILIGQIVYYYIKNRKEISNASVAKEKNETKDKTEKEIDNEKTDDKTESIPDKKIETEYKEEDITIIVNEEKNDIENEEKQMMINDNSN